MLLGFLTVGGIMLYGVVALYKVAGYDPGTLAIYALIIFVVAWIGQFIGHKIEGKKPSFLQDVQYLLIGPAWLLHFIFKKIGIEYWKFCNGFYFARRSAAKILPFNKSSGRSRESKENNLGWYFMVAWEDNSTALLRQQPPAALVRTEDTGEHGGI